MNKRFTFIELILSIGFFSIISLVAFNLLKTQTNVINSTTSSIENKENARVILNRTRDIIKKEPFIYIKTDGVLIKYDDILKKKWYLIDFDGKKMRGYLNYIKEDNTILDRNGNLVAENISNYYVTRISEELIEITVSSKQNKEEITLNGLIKLY